MKKIRLFLASIRKKIARKPPIMSIKRGIVTVHLQSPEQSLSGAEWIRKLKLKGVNLGRFAEDIILSSNFKPQPSQCYTIKFSLPLEHTPRQPDTHFNFDPDPKPHENGQLEIACLLLNHLTPAEWNRFGMTKLILQHRPICTEESGAPWRLCIMFEKSIVSLIVAGERHKRFANHTLLHVTNMTERSEREGRIKLTTA